MTIPNTGRRGGGTWDLDREHYRKGMKDIIPILLHLPKNFRQFLKDIVAETRFIKIVRDSLRHANSKA
jgi:hypothetical protein